MPRASPVLAHIGQSSGDDLPKECPGGEAEEADPQRVESFVCVDADHPMYLRLGKAVRLGLALEIAVADERTLLELGATLHLGGRTLLSATALSTRTLSAVTRSAPTSAVPMAAPRLPAVCEASRHQEHAAAGWPAHREAARQPSNANGGRGQ